MRVCRLIEVARARSSITTSVGIDDLRFHSTVWYSDVDLNELAALHGDELVERIAFHVALFQLNTLVSLRPDVIDLGPYARHFTPALAMLWNAVTRGVWAQWRHQHGVPLDHVPGFATSPVSANAAPGRAPDGNDELLVFCGGGKDSLVAMRLLERASLPFATLAYSHSIYGRAEPQHVLIEQLASAVGRTRAERQWVIDDLLDSPVADLRADFDVQYLLAAETPASVFAALPLALTRGYRGLVVAHEASANAPQHVVNGTPINHQWGKSWEAELLLDRYIREHLLANVHYFSLLQPVHDEVILELLARDAGLAHLTHSCNIDKPWCGACAKCAYVWLQFAAHLPAEVIEKTFGARNDTIQRDCTAHVHRLVGLGKHAPFECVGSAAESQLALALARDRDMLGPWFDSIRSELGPIDITALARPLVTVGDKHGMPPHVKARILPLLRDAARTAAVRLRVTDP